MGNKTANSKGKAKSSETSTNSGRQLRKRHMAESEEEVESSRPFKKSAGDHLSEAERQAIYKEMSQKVQAKKKAQHERETQGAFL